MNGSAGHNLSDPLTRDISVTDCWTNTHPVSSSDSGPPGNVVFAGNEYINTSCGEAWPLEARRNSAV